VSPKVSIILPTYNRAYVISRAIKSVLNQTYQDFELIIIDDGSTDNTEELIGGFSTEKIRYVRRGEKRGVCAARNAGLRVAGGTYIAFQDSDDEWMPSKLERQITALETAPPSNIAGRFFVTTPALVIRRQCFETAGWFDESFPVNEDWELFLRMSKLYSYIGIDEFLMTRYLQPDSLTGRNIYFVKAFNQLVKKYYDDIKQDPKLLSECYFKLGHCLIVDGDITGGRRHLLKGARINPLNFKNHIAFLLSLTGKTVYNTLAKMYRRIRLAATGYQF
jgi:glycosyltransferase involved in cell wall biosynthesis